MKAKVDFAKKIQEQEQLATIEAGALKDKNSADQALEKE